MKYVIIICVWLTVLTGCGKAYTENTAHTQAVTTKETMSVRYVTPEWYEKMLENDKKIYVPIK